MFVEVVQRRLLKVCVVAHRPELEHPEGPIVCTHPDLREQDGPARIELDQEGCQSHERREENEACYCQSEIERALDQA